MTTQFTKKYLLWLLLAFAAGLRIWHLNWGLPELYEEAFPFAISWKFWNWGNPGVDFNPHFFHYPGLAFYLNFIIQAAYFLVGFIIGWFPDLAAFQRAYEADPTVFILLSRCLSVLFDVGTVYILFRLGTEIVNEQAGLLAGFLAAVSPLLIKQSHLVNVDTLLTFFAILSILFFYRLSEREEKKWYVWSGITIGLAASSKYNGALLLIVLTAVHFFTVARNDKIFAREKLLNWATAVALSGIVFIATNPFSVLSFEEFYTHFKFEEMHMGAGHLGLSSTEQTWEFYLLRSLPEHMGWPLLIAAFCTLAYLLFRRRNLFPVAGLLPVIYLTVICTWNMRADRYLLPVIPPLILLASIGIIFARDYVAQWKFPEVLTPVFALPGGRLLMFTIVTVILFVQPLIGVSRYHQSVALPDTRVAAKEWVIQHMPKGSIIGTILFGMHLPDSLFRIFPIPFLAVNTERVAAFYDTRWFEDFDMVVGTSYDYDRYAIDPIRYKEFLSYYATLQREWKLAAEFVPTGGQPGPAIWLFQPYPVSKTKSFPPALLDRLKTAPESTRVSYFVTNLAKAVFQKGNVVKTEQLLREIISVEVHNIAARRLLFDLLVNQGRFIDALEVVRDYLAVDPNHATMLWLQGNLLLRMNDAGKAELSLQKAVQLDPGLSAAYDDLLQVYVQRRDKQKAIEVLSKHLAILPPGSKKAQLVMTDLKRLRNMR